MKGVVEEAPTAAVAAAQQALLVDPLDRVLVIHQYRTQVGSLAELQAGIHEIGDVFAQHVSGVFCNKTEQMRGPAVIRIVDDDDSGAEALVCRSAQGESAQIDGGNWAPAVIENARHPFGGLRQLLQLQQRHDLDHAAGVECVAVVAQLEEQKQHD